MPKTKNNRSRFVGVRFTPDEYARIESAAQKAEVELSVHVRAVLLNVAIPSEARRMSPDREALGRALVALNRIGGNINQLAKAAHVSGDLLAYRSAEEDRALLAEAVRMLLSALG